MDIDILTFDLQKMDTDRHLQRLPQMDMNILTGKIKNLICMYMDLESMTFLQTGNPSCKYPLGEQEWY